MDLTQLSTQYMNSPIIDDSPSLQGAYPKVGERAPDVILGDKQHLHHYLHTNKHHILLFAGTRQRNQH